MTLIYFVMEDFTENSPQASFKLPEGLSVMKSNSFRSTSDILGKVTSVELVKIVVQESSQSNYKRDRRTGDSGHENDLSKKQRDELAYS